MIEVRVLFENELKVLEKTQGYEVRKIPIESATLESSTKRVEDYLIVGRGDYGYPYRVNTEDITVSSDGTIEFEAVGIPNAKYVIRAIKEGEDIRNLNTENQEEEEE